MEAPSTDVAIEASDLTVATCVPLRTPFACRGVRSETIKGNLFWAFACNVVALPLAATGGSGDDFQFGVRGVQQPAAAPVHRTRKLTTRA
jgi:cation transport ATPase